MKKIIAFFTIAILIGVSLVFLASFKSKKNPETGRDKIIVAASFYPLAEFAKRIGGEYVEVVNITPAGAEAHDYEPTPRDIAAIRASKVFLYQGGGFDPWAERVAEDLTNTEIITVEMYSHFIESGKEDTGKTDPHLWLNPVNAQKEVTIIKEALIAADANHEIVFSKNEDSFIAELKELDKFIDDGLRGCARRDIVVSHEAFNHFAERYGLRVTSISGLSPEEEPSAQQLGDVARFAKEKNINTIFFETLVSPKLAETVAKEAGLTTSVLNPLEGLTDQEISSGKNYLSVMADNLHNLRQALQCP